MNEVTLLSRARISISHCSTTHTGSFYSRAEGQMTTEEGDDHLHLLTREKRTLGILHHHTILYRSVRQVIEHSIGS